MSDEVYSKIIDELRDNNFGSIIPNKPILSFLGYQEPLSNAELLKKRVYEAWSKLSNNIEIVSHTNGDFLTKENLDNLLLTTLRIMDYDNKGVEYWKNKMTDAGILVMSIDYDAETIIGIHRYIGNITCSCNWTKHALLENRGGFFKQGDLSDMQWKNDMKQRIFPCPEPTYYINISYDGSVMPCCHLRPDNPNHKDFILGNVADSTLTEIHYSNKAIDLKRKLSIENGEYPEPCKYCQKFRDDVCIGDRGGIEYDGDKYNKQRQNNLL